MCNCTGIMIIGGQTTYTDCNSCSSCKLMTAQQSIQQNNSQTTTQQPRCINCDDAGWIIDPKTRFPIQCSCQIR